ncbi:sugar phosphate isomerase/epimerase family protein [Halosimplex aquaticum]
MERGHVVAGVDGLPGDPGTYQPRPADDEDVHGRRTVRTRIKRRPAEAPAGRTGPGRPLPRPNAFAGVTLHHGHVSRLRYRRPERRVQGLLADRVARRTRRRAGDPPRTLGPAPLTGARRTDRRRGTGRRRRGGPDRLRVRRRRPRRAGQAREHFRFADRLGAEYVTVNYPPAADAITEELVDLADEFGLDVGIHNYSSVHHDDLSRVFSTIDDARSVLDRYDHDRLGLCVDTGHFLVEDVTPADVVRDLGDRINSCHLKDTSEAEIEDVPGAGQLDVASFVGLLDDHAHLDAPLVVEYELPQDRAPDALREAVDSVRTALDD